jgi:isopentenyl-diphosphate delta-isomerase
MEDLVVLVDMHDNEMGTMEKLAAHSNGGRLHRAISIFIFNSKDQLMLQQRADSKYHSGGLWTNTVCSHPLPGETPIEAAHRKLVQEMGFDCDMHETFSFTYEAYVGNGLTEKEFDHVIFGNYDNEPRPNPEEAKGWRWIGLRDLRDEIRRNPESYTKWLNIVIDNAIESHDRESGRQRHGSVKP